MNKKYFYLYINLKSALFIKKGCRVGESTYDSPKKWLWEFFGLSAAISPQKLFANNYRLGHTPL